MEVSLCTAHCSKVSSPCAARADEDLERVRALVGGMRRGRSATSINSGPPYSVTSVNSGPPCSVSEGMSGETGPPCSVSEGMSGSGVSSSSASTSVSPF
eukprot:1958850-Amphidinium_carterae.1